MVATLGSVSDSALFISDNKQESRIQPMLICLLSRRNEREVIQKYPLLDGCEASRQDSFTSVQPLKFQCKMRVFEDEGGLVIAGVT